MSRDVKVTGESYIREEGIKFIIDIWKDIFPKKIEEKYVELANLVFQYGLESNKLLSSSRSINSIGSEMDAISANKQQANGALEELSAILQEIKKKNLDGTITIDDIANFSSQFLTASDVLVTNVARKESELDQEYNINREAAGNAHVAINDLIAQITDKLHEIDKLSIDGMDRLDNIKVDDGRHLSRIDNNQELSARAKATLKELLRAYCNMRIVAFKSLIEQAHEVCSAYKAREVIKYNDPRVAKQTLIYNSLMDLTDNFLDNLVHLMLPNSSTIEDFIISNSDDFIKAMNLYTSYLMGDIAHIDVSTIDYLSKNSRYISRRALTDLVNIVKPEVLNFSHPNSRS